MKLPSYKPRELIKKFETLGFIFDRQKGSHFIMYHPVTTKRAVIPNHLGDIPKGTLHAIIKQTGLQESDFLSKK